MRLEPPEMRSETPESHLHFVSDANRVRPAHVTINLRQIVRWKNNLAADAGQCFSDVRRDSTTLGAGTIKNLLNITRVLRARLLVFAAIRATKIIGQRRDMHPRLLPASPGSVKFVRADVDERAGVAVVGVFENDEVFFGRMCACQT